MKDDLMKRSIKICRPVLSSNNGRSRVTAKILVEGNAKELWFEVDDEYGKYLCSERSDAYLVGLLWIALTRHYDIECEAPVTGELLHQIETILIPALASNSKVMRAPKITCPIEPMPIPNVGAVGTGMSCGVDSFHAVKTYYNHSVSSLRLTHLAVFNVGAFGLYDIEKAEPQFRWQVEDSRKVADELGLKFIVGNSNFKQQFFTDHRYTHTYVSMFAVLMLQKLWGTYMYASAGCGAQGFCVKDADRLDAAHYDTLSLKCYSTRALKIYSDGETITRFDKMREIVDFPPVQKHLHVCCSDGGGGGNCSICFKCKRTLLALDALGVLDEFVDVFNVMYYRQHRNRYLYWLVAQRFAKTDEYVYQPELFGILRREIPWHCFVIGLILGFKEMIKIAARNSLFVYRLYWRLKGGLPDHPCGA